MRVSRIITVFVAAVFLSRAAHAQNPFKHAGLDLLHAPNSAIPNEQVDPASGTLTVVGTDLVLPGNAGLDLVVQRVYNSSVYPNYSNGGDTTIDEDSWAGTGWKLHFGRIIHSDSSTAGEIQIEMGDGSRHPLYHSLANANIWTTTDFWLYNPATHVLQLPNGRVYKFDREVTHPAPIGTTRYVTEISDPFNNRITFSYFSAPGPLDGVQQIQQHLSATQIREINFTYDATHKALASMTYLTHTWTYDQAALGSNGMSVLTGVHPPAGPVTNYEYSGGEMAAVVAPFGGRIAYVYNDATRTANSLSMTTRVVTSRTLSGRDVSTGTWTFAYSTGTNADTTSISAPCGGVTKYKFNGTGTAGSFVGWSAGTLAEISVEEGGVLLERRTMTWAQSEAISNDPVSGQSGVWTDAAVYKPLLASQSTLRGTRTFTTNYTYHSGQGNINDYGNAYLIEELGETIYQFRSTTRTFQYGFTPYILGRVASQATTQRTAFLQWDGTTESSWSYNAATGALTGQSIRGIGTTFETRSDGNVGAVIDARGNRTEFPSYSWGRATAIDTPGPDTAFVVSPEGLVTSTTTGSITTTYGYDPAFRLGSVQTSGMNARILSPDDLHGAWIREDQGSSSVMHLVDAFGREHKSYNSQGLYLSDVIRDSCGRVVVASDPFTTLPLTLGTSTQYDALGRVKQVTDPAGKVTSFTYNGPSVTRTDAKGRTTNFEYMAFGDPANAILVNVIDADANVTTYRYDVTGALTNVSGPLAGVERSWVVDYRGLVTSETQPESGTTAYTYDAAGNLATTTDANGSATTLTYDAANRLAGRDAPGSVDDLTITYDTTGRIATLAGASATTTFTYDVPNRTVTRADQIAPGTFTSIYTSDANGNLAALRYPSGRVVDYHYDAENRLTSIDHTPPGAGSSSVFANAFTYGPGGQLESYATGAVTHRFTYEANRPKRIWTTGGTDALDLTYSYDNVGNVTAIADPRVNATQTFVPDPLDRLTTAEGLWGKLTWTYDAAGNRLTETARLPGTLADSATNYTYQASTQRLTGTTGANVESFGYDNIGQLTSDGIISAYSYSPLGRLTGASGSGASASYTYDASGERLSKTVNGQTIYSLRSTGGQTLSEYVAACASATWSRDLLYAGGSLLGAAKAVSTQPTVSMAAATASAGEADGTVSLQVQLSTPGGAPLGCVVTVSYRTTPGTTVEGADFTRKSGTVTFPAGSLNGATQSIVVPIQHDTLSEADETFTVGLSGAMGATIGATAATTVTVTDNDPPPTLSVSGDTVTEPASGTVTATFTVSLSAISGRSVTMTYATSDYTARDGHDYQGATGPLTILAGAQSATISVAVNGDRLDEPFETFLVTLSSPVGATIATGQGTGTILDDDGLATTWGDLVEPLDGAADFTVYNPSTKLWRRVDSNTGALSTFGPWGDTATYNDVFVPGDYSGDGKTDYGVFRPGASGGWYYLRNGDVTYTTIAVPWTPAAGDIPVPGDYDGDGKTDAAIYRPSEGYWHIRKSSTSTELIVDWGIAGATVAPVPADYDGDDKTDWAFYYPTTGYWYVVPSTTGTAQYVNWGMPGAAVKPAPADVDGDGKADLAFLNPADQFWYVVKSSDGQPLYVNWGVGANDEPVVADYDADGKADVAFYEPASKTFFVIRSTTGLALYVTIPSGAANDVPVLRRPR